MLIFDITNTLSPTDLDIGWKLFVDQIVPMYFNDTYTPLTFMEIGSLNGADTVYFKDKYTNSVCHCIEGLPDNYNKYLVHINTPDINCYNTCISASNGTIEFHQKNGLESGIHGIYNRGDRYGTNKLIVPTVTLDTLCSTNGIDSIDIVKIDVEGATYDILNSSKDGILNQIKMLHIETEDYPFFAGQKLDKDCEQILTDKGFVCICKTGYNPTTDGKQYDSVWINSNLLIN